MRTRWWWLLLLGSIGCAGAGVKPGPEPTDSGSPTDSRAPTLPVNTPDAMTTAPSPVDAATVEAAPPVRFMVYAHTATELYAVDPETLTVALIGKFTQRDPVRGTSTPLYGITDIAVDHDGGMVGIISSQVYRIDARTAECTPLANGTGFSSFNGLSWIPSATGEILLAAGVDGNVWRIDPATGMPTMIGAMGAGMGCSGDLVSVNKFGTLVTIRRDGMTTDWLASLDPTTGAATPIGDIGFSNVWGIGFWKDRVFGFTSGGQFILIDPVSGKGSLVQTMAGLSWWGAGVSTAVFVIP